MQSAADPLTVSGPHDKGDGRGGGPPLWPHTVITAPGAGRSNSGNVPARRFDRAVNHSQFKTRWLPVAPYLVQAKKLLYFSRSHPARVPGPTSKQDTWVSLARNAHNRELAEERDAEALSPIKVYEAIDHELNSPARVGKEEALRGATAKSLPNVRWNTGGSVAGSPSGSPRRRGRSPDRHDSTWSVGRTGSPKLTRSHTETVSQHTLRRNEHMELQHRLSNDRPLMEFGTTKLLKHSSTLLEASRKYSGIYESSYHRQGHTDYTPGRYHRGHEYASGIQAKPKFVKILSFHEKNTGVVLPRLGSPAKRTKDRAGFSVRGRR